MKTEKNTVIEYQGNKICLLSDDVNDYINLTDMAKAWKGRKSIQSWLKTKQTLEFLKVWEEKHNLDFKGSQMSAIYKMAKEVNRLSIKTWIEVTDAKGIFSIVGTLGGVYAHKDIAIKFAGWLSPEFELYLVEEIQRLKKLENKKEPYFTEEQVMFLVRLCR